MKIKLTQNKYAIVDDEDFKSLSKYKWYVAKRGYGFYAQRHIIIDKKHINQQMHRVILNAKKNKEVDHVNGNTLDNRKSNLRIVSRSQNEWNRDKQKNNSTGYKGITYVKRDKLFIARIRVYGKLIYLGGFKDKKRAAEAYNKGAKQYHGKFARLNKI